MGLSLISLAPWGCWRLIRFSPVPMSPRREKLKVSRRYSSQSFTQHVLHFQVRGLVQDMLPTSIYSPFLPTSFLLPEVFAFLFPFSYPPLPHSSAILLLLWVTDSLSFWYVCKGYPSFYYTLVIYIFYVLFAISIMINVDGGGYGSHLSPTAICQESPTHPPRISTDFSRVIKIPKENCDRDEQIKL